MCSASFNKDHLLQSVLSAEPDGEHWPPQRKRIFLYELGSWCCSIVGTCLTHDDLLAMARKWNVNIGADARMFDVHGFFVQEAGKRGDISRALQKLLDSRYKGFVRRIAKIKDHDRLVDFWNTSVNDGFVAGAYWAIVSHTHVPTDLQSRIFGEVHMMSHLMGGSAQRIVGAAAEMQAEMSSMEKRHERWSAQTRRSIERRDTKIIQLQDKLDDTRKQLLKAEKNSETADSTMVDRSAKLLLKRERALIASRTKNRELEAELAALKQQYATMRERAGRSKRPALAPDYLPKRGLCGKAVLYLGGRTNNIVHMRKVAEELSVEFLHHDGGLEQSHQLIGELVEKCDAVVCPINCINHQACMKAKRLCKRLNKPFMPVATTGQSSFSKALGELAEQMIPGIEAVQPNQRGA
ncbi:MAG: DUF2325 domain-containing protein [Pseudomonadota bacterium]